MTTNQDILDDSDGLISLREAIFYAESGDTILFSEAVSGQTILLLGHSLIIDKSLTIDASALADGITIDGNQKDKVFTVGGTSENSVEFRNLTITGGNTHTSYDYYSPLHHGAGINNAASALTLTNCTVSGNSASYGCGGGIYNESGTLAMTGCTINGNSTKSYSYHSQGGGIYNKAGTLTMTNCTVDNNSCSESYEGGGIYNESGTLTMTNCEINKNSSEGIYCKSGMMTMTDCDINENGGGGIYCGSAALTLTGCMISENSGYEGGGIKGGGEGIITLTNCTVNENSGGGIYSRGGTLTLINCEVSKNSYGGGISLENGNLLMADCSVTNNSSNNGGGIYLYGSATLTNCVISGNTANSNGGGIYDASVTKNVTTLTNCTISGNSAFHAGGISGSETPPILTNCIVTMNYAETSQNNYYGAYSELSQNNIIGGYNPLFVSGPVFDAEGKLANADTLDLRLTAGSRAVNAGNMETTLSEYDLDGNARVYGDTVDLGAYEFQRAATESPTFSTVVDTLNDSFDANDGEWSFREALYWATGPGTITFAESLSGGTIYLNGRLDIYGMNIDGGELGVTLDAQQKSRVISTSGDVTLKGLTITGGNMVSAGGGICNIGTLTLTDCTICENTTDGSGGGIYNLNGVLTMTNCTVSGNSASSSGGIWNYQGEVLLVDCVIASNFSFYGGGGISNDYGVMSLINCAVNDNTSQRSGGGIYNDGRSDCGALTLTNCIVSKNSAGNYGGGIYNYGGSSPTTLIHCTISGNIATNGGGIYFDGNSLTLYNSIVALNTANTNADIDNPYKSRAYNVLSTFTNWTTSENALEYDPTKPLFLDVSNGDYRLAPGSQASEMGNNQYAYDAGMDETWLDLAGEPRFIGENIDLGAYESAGLYISQHSVYVGNVSTSWEQYKNAANVRLSWISGTTTSVLGLFDSVGEYVWDTTQYADGYGQLKVEYLDADGKAIITSIFSSLVLNDESIIVHRGDLTESQTWANDKIHLVLGRLNIKSGATLTIEKETVVKFWKNAYIYAETDSELSIRDGVILTRAEDDEIGGDTNKDGNLSVAKNGNSYLRGTGTFNLGQITQKFIIQTTSGAISADQTWLSDMVYHVIGNITVTSGATLTILPGAIIKFDSGCSLIVNSGGKLVAEGNSAQPIVFTSVKDDAYGGDTNEDDGEYGPQSGEWEAIKIKGGTATLNYTKILYGGSNANNSDDGAVYVASGSMTLKNSVVAHAKLVGIHSGSGATLNVVNSVIEDCMYGTHNGNYTNCTFAGLNYLTNTNYYYYGGRFTNCIITDFNKGIYSKNKPTNYTYNNCVFYNPVNSGPQSFSAVGTNGNIWANPLFRDVANGDYRLQPGSPCIDAGDGTIAPETDITGAPRSTDLYSTQTGTPNDSGDYADIGAYEFTDNAGSSIDLEPINIKAPASVTIGEKVTVQWTVRNNESSPANKAWSDGIYLVSSTGRQVLVKNMVR